MNKKDFDLIATLNGIGLANTSLLNRVAGKRHGVHYPKESTVLSPQAGKAIEHLRSYPFTNPDHKLARPDLRREGKRDRAKIGRDYSGFPPQKRSKASYKLAKGRRVPPATPRQRPWVVPEKYAALVAAETPSNVVEAPARFKLKP